MSYLSATKSEGDGGSAISGRGSRGSGGGTCGVDVGRSGGGSGGGTSI